MASRTGLILCAPLLALWPAEAAANFPLTPQNNTIDFTGFTGSGFDPAPAAGQLDSDFWVVRGVSDGDSDFGDSLNTGDYAEGLSFGNEADGGVWAFDVGPSVVLGANLTDDDFTPGSYVLRVQNDTGQTIDDLDITSTIWMNNNGNRSNDVAMAFSADDSIYVTVETLVTPEAADLMGWTSQTTQIMLQDADFSDGEQFYVRWQFDEVSGSGSHDEFGVDDITLFIHDICGNGVPEAGEDCDDGNLDNTDACVDGCVDAACGDGFTQAGVEGCDDGDADNTDACPDGAGGTCQPATCGDTFVQAGVEDCDDGNDDDTDACIDCVDAACGDGFTQAGVEGCDDGNMDNTDACPDGAGGTCQDAECGDGFVYDGVEECDDGNTVDDEDCLADCTLPLPGTTTSTTTDTDTEGDTTSDTTDGTTMGLDDTGTTGPDETTGGPDETTTGTVDTTSGSASATASGTTPPGTSSSGGDSDTDTDGVPLGEDAPSCGCRGGSAPSGLLLLPLVLLFRRRR